MKVSNYKEVFFKISKVLWTIKPQMNSDWNGKNGLLFFTRTSTGPVEHFRIKYGTNLGIRDEFELEFSGSSQAKLWRFRAEPSQAEPSWGTSIFELKPSWQYRQYVCQKIAIVGLYHDYNQFQGHFYELM